MGVRGAAESFARHSLELNAKIAKIIFNGTYIKRGTASESYTKTINGAFTVSAGQRLEIWRCPVGILELYNSSRWDANGYSAEAREYVPNGYHEASVKPYRAAGAPYTIPHSGEGS